MSNSTNLRQLELLISSMEENPDIANGFTSTREKEELQKFWKELEMKLNSLGPPTKSTFEWKKVWLDKKKYVRGKIAENIKKKKATGGGPFKEFKFSKLEEAILSLCSMRESVEGCPNAATFGLPSCNKKRRIESQGKENSASLEATLETIGLDESTSKSPPMGGQPTESQPAADDYLNPTKPTRKREKRIDNAMTTDYLEKELNIQKEICDKIGKAVDFLENHYEESSRSIKKIYRSLDSLNDKQNYILQEFKRHNIQTEQQEQEKIEEIKRHNARMENWRLREIEFKSNFKRELLKIEEEKLKRM